MKLTESFTLPSGRTLKNRVLMAPMTNSSSHPNGDVAEEELVYYARRAKSGIGAIITACANVEPLGIGFPNAIAADTDERIPSLAKLASAIKDNGSVAILQIFHAGRMSNPDLLHGEQPVSASAVAAIRPDAVTPREMSGEEIDATIRAFGDATRRAIEAGFDGVEIHGANTYLIQQFFSPHSNRRTDKWGGDVKERMAFPLAVIESVKQAVREHAKSPFIIGYRLSPEEQEEPGITMEDTIKLVEVLAKQNVDYIHVSVGNFFTDSIRNKDDQETRVGLIQKAVGDQVPVIGVGALQTSGQVEKALDVVPLIALGHALIYDPDWLIKVQQGETPFDVIYRSKKEELDLPENLFNMVTNAPGWFKVED